MKAEEVPDELVPLLEGQLLDKVPTQEALAVVLTAWKKIERQQIREANQGSMYHDRLLELRQQVQLLTDKVNGAGPVMTAAFQMYNFLTGRSPRTQTETERQLINAVESWVEDRRQKALEQLRTKW